jgi:excisionase family DNA binding protein
MDVNLRSAKKRGRMNNLSQQHENLGPNRRRILTRHEMAEFFRVDIQTIDRHRNEGKIPSIQFGRRVLFDLEAVLKKLSEN